jgi:hypothetical protein
MASTDTQGHYKLPFLGLDTETINSRDLQTIGSRLLDEIHESGLPRIVCVKERKGKESKERRAVLVDFDQYARMQESFEQLFFIVSDILTIQRKNTLSDASKEEMEETFHQVRRSLPDRSPVGAYFDRLLHLSENYFSSSVTAPTEATQRMQNKLEASGKKVIKKNGSLSRRPYQE